MTDQASRTLDHAIHIGATSTLINGMHVEAEANGLTVIHLDLKGITDRKGLADRLAKTFLFPYPNSGLDGAADFISDLEWFEDSPGFLIVVQCADAPLAVIVGLASILPMVVDRWRSEPNPFVVVIGQTPHRAGLLAALNEANADMDRAGALSWAQPGTGSVPVIDHLA